MWQSQKEKKKKKNRFGWEFGGWQCIDPHDHMSKAETRPSGLHHASRNKTNEERQQQQLHRQP